MDKSGKPCGRKKKLSTGKPGKKKVLHRCNRETRVSCPVSYTHLDVYKRQALSGLRDMSTIEQPPHDRYPVQTFVLEHSDRILDEAIRRELSRGGQVYYLHNRVESIDECAAKLKDRLGAVSYTHLDVYKRQGKGRSCLQLVFKVRFGKLRQDCLPRADDQPAADAGNR